MSVEISHHFNIVRDGADGWEVSLFETVNGEERRTSQDFSSAPNITDAIKIIHDYLKREKLKPDYFPVFLREVIKDGDKLIFMTTEVDIKTGKPISVLKQFGAYLIPD